MEDKDSDLMKAQNLEFFTLSSTALKSISGFLGDLLRRLRREEFKNSKLMGFKSPFQAVTFRNLNASRKLVCNFHLPSSTVRGVMSGLSLHEVMSKLEPLIRNVVREEVERVIQLFLHSSQRPSLTQIESSRARGWQLHFVDKLPSTLFTGNRIETEDSTAPKVVICDASSKNIITSGPLSSIKIEIVVLDGGFGTDEREDWTEEEFNASVVREREGKRPLVTGELTITLRDGVGYFSDICFTDNSSWTRSRKFRLGARIVQSISSEFRIREARSGAFVVKDHRGELYKKHHPPSLGDEVWRLEKISKDGKFHRRLASNEIHTVKDFLQLYNVNPSSLRNMLGGGTCAKIWETIIEHATACLIDDDKLYMYYVEAQRAGLLFNAVYKVVGAIFDGVYLSLDKLTYPQKRLAYKKVKELVPVDEPSIFGLSRPLWSLQADPLGSLSLGPQQLDFPVANLGQPEAQLGFNPSTLASPYEVEDGSQFQVSAAQNLHPVQVFTPNLGSSFMVEDSRSGPYSGENGWAPSGLPGQVVLTNHLAVNDTSQVQTSTWLSVPAMWGQGIAPFSAAGNGAEVGIISSHPSFGVHNSRGGKPKARWRKIRAAVKWGIWVRRGAAAKRMARVLCLDI